VLHEILTRDCGETLLCSGDRSTERIAVPCLGGQELLHMLGGLVPDHLDLLDDHSPLPLHLLPIESGIAVHVGENLRDPCKMIG
jgi:hypothetical protein